VEEHKTKKDCKYKCLKKMMKKKVDIKRGEKCDSLYPIDTLVKRKPLISKYLMKKAMKQYL